MVKLALSEEGNGVALFDSTSFGKPDIRGTGAAVLQGQQAIGGTPDAPAGTPAPKAAELGVAVTQAQTKEVGQNIQTGMASQELAGKVAVNRYATQQRTEMVRKRGDTQRNLMQARLDMSNLGRDLDQKLLQDRLTFAADEQGLKFTNARQFADFKRMVAKDDEEFQNYAQEVQQKSAKKSKMLAIATAKIEAILDQNSRSRIKQLSQEQTLYLAKKAKDAKQAQKDHAARAQGIGMVFTAAGMVAGGIYGGPAGAAGGAAVGGSIGAAAGAAVNYGLDETGN